MVLLSLSSDIVFPNTNNNITILYSICGVYYYFFINHVIYYLNAFSTCTIEYKMFRNIKVDLVGI